MFTLDDLIRNAVQQALRLLKPEEQTQTTTQSEQQQQQPFIQSMPPICCIDANNRQQQHQSPSIIQPCGGASSSSLSSYSEQIKLLCDELITVEKRLLGVLEAAFSDRQERIRAFCSVASSSNNLQQEQNLLLSSLNDDSGIGSGGTLAANITGDIDLEGDESIREWLRRIGCDEHSIELIERECYTKRDLLEFVTREELIRLGIRGGLACRIWRHIIRSRMDRSNSKLFSPTTTRSICNTPPLASGLTGNISSISAVRNQRH
uniref:SAM domain-containing protein n=1 Tax=Meloidogyne hapla TaxID=6305 RepID=A0A1I8AXS0_MELHA